MPKAKMYVQIIHMGLFKLRTNFFLALSINLKILFSKALNGTFSTKAIHKAETIGPM